MNKLLNNKMCKNLKIDMSEINKLSEKNDMFVNTYTNYTKTHSKYTKEKK